MLDAIRLGRRRGGKLRSFFASAIAPETFLRKVPLTFTVSDSAWSWQMLIYLVRIPRCKGHSIHRNVLAGRSRHIYGVSTSCPKQEGSRSARADRIEQPSPNRRCVPPFHFRIFLMIQ